MRRFWIIQLFLVIHLLTLVACGGGSAPSGNSVADTESASSSMAVTIHGRVRNRSGVADVLVSSGSHKTVSDGEGYYELRGVDVNNKDRVIVTFSKANFALNQKVVPLSEDMNSYSVDAHISPYDYVGSIDSNSSQIQQVFIADPADPTAPALVEVSFPVGSIPSTEIITVSVKRGDPSSVEGKAIFPGPYLGIATAQANQSPEFIESVVFTEISLQELRGKEIKQLNKPATVTLQLPLSLQSSYAVGETIPWWSYDEELGIWVREDADPATEPLDDAEIISKSGLLYAQAQATHFSWWNVDKPINERACLCAEVVDQDDAPLKNIAVVANGITYNAGSTLHYTASDGRACMTVKRTQDTTKPAKVELHAEYGSLKYHYKVLEPEEGIVNTATVYTPTVVGSTIDVTEGECQSLNNKFKLFLDSEIYGTVKDELDHPITGFEFSSDLGKTITTDEEGRYSTEAPGGAHVTLFKPRVFSRAIDVSYTEPTEANFVIENQPPWVQLFNVREHTPSNNNEQWLLTVLASDPEGGELSYQWHSDVGTIAVTGAEGSTAIFTAPNNRSGTATITLTITDAKGAITTVSEELSWGMALEDKTNLKIYFRDNKDSEQPIAGLIVNLHDEDGSITQRYVSNSEGIVDAGDIGKDKLTFSVLVQDRPSVFDLHPYSISNYMHTFMDVEVGDIIFYLDHYNSVLSPSPSHMLEAQPSLLANLHLSAVDTSARYAWRANAKSNNKLRTTGTGTDIQSVSIQDLDLNSDGNLDLLSYVTSGNNDDVLGYDFVLDQAVVPSESYPYDLSLSRTASSVNWSRSLATLDNQGTYNLRLYAQRKGKLYSYTPFQRPSSLYNPLADTGDFTMLPEFPADRYLVELYGYEPNSDNSFVGGYRYYPYPPQSVELIEPEQKISAGKFSDSSFSWSISGSSDLTILKMTPPGCGLSNFNWYVWMDGNSNNWSLIEPPDEVAGCISNASIRNAIGGFDHVSSYIDRFYIQRQELDVVSSYSGLWSLLASGVDLEQMALQRSYVRHSLYTHEDVP
ncbi:MAG: hypothetical protein OEX12_01435 [Gammaproteobacteria bacterium]|nr:hypothetical protein [Gammaproteobacteria bacterium]